MGFRNTPSSWGWLSRLMHWVMAGLIVFMLAVGYYMTNALTGTDSDTLMMRFDLTQMHKSWGFTVFALALVRILWRVVNPTPVLPEGTSRTARLLAHLGHYGLYICMIGMPITGWLMSSASTLQDAYGIKNMVFGAFELPDPFVPGSDTLETAFATAHGALGSALSILVLGHIAAALKHHLINRDGVLRRMIRG